MRCNVHSLRPYFLFVFCFCIQSSASSLPSTEVRSVCMSDCAKKALIGEDTRYQDCMSVCLTPLNQTWLLANDGECTTIASSAGSVPACSTAHIDVTSFRRNVSETSPWGLYEIKEYIVVAWTPCPYGIDDVTGYEVQLFETQFSGYSYCKSVILKTRLGIQNVGERFSVLFNRQELDYSTTYQIWVEGLPKSDHRYHAYVVYNSLSCSEMNSYGSCVCGMQGLEKLPMPSVKTLGNSVLVSLHQLEGCFNVDRYRLSILHSGNSTSALYTIDITPTDNLTVWNHTFSPIFGPRPGSQILVQYHVFSNNGDYRTSEPLTVKISDWEATVTSTSVDRQNGRLTITWPCAALFYNITKYEVRVNIHSFHTGHATYHMSRNITSTCEKSTRLIRHIFSLSRSGTYSVQVRESRERTLYSDAPEWSKITPNTSFVYEIETESADKTVIIICVVLFFPIALILLGTLALLYCGRRGCCKKIRHQLPFPIDYFLSLPQSFQHRSKSIWIVWQADSRNAIIGELHSENIRHLASYLANHCGLNVILDQYELLLSGNLSAWIQGSRDKAEVVIFVCPHVSKTADENMDMSVPNTMGNFTAIFRFYEKEILAEDNISKFVTVTLPYSDKNASAAVELLLKTTPVFNLMDDIEDLYFFIQGYPKANRFGRHVVRNVHKHEFEDTLEGKALSNGVNRMLQLQRAGIDCIEPNPRTYEDRISLDISTHFVDAVEPDSSLGKTLLNEKKSFKPCPPPPLTEGEDADESMFLINTHGLLSLQYPTSQEPQAVVFDHSCLFVPPTEYGDTNIRKNILLVDANSSCIESSTSNAASSANSGRSRKYFMDNC